MDRAIPSVVAVGRTPDDIVIGEAARALGEAGRSNVAGFKMHMGLGPKEVEETGGKNTLWAVPESDSKGRVFSPMEATKIFLKTLLSTLGEVPAQLVIGVPMLPDRWQENFRANLRSVAASLGLDAPVFFPEPFAVYQYYRHVERLIPDTDDSQTVLIVDIGGGSTDCCVIRTTARGELARSGVHSKPVGYQSCDAAGLEIDRSLLRLVIDRTQHQGVRYLDDPFERGLKKGALFAVERAKIQLSQALAEASPADRPTLRATQARVAFPRGVVHGTDPVECFLTGEDLWNVIQTLWNRSIGKTILDAHRMAAEKLGGIASYDYVLLAGGSSSLPFLSQLAKRTLPNEIRAGTLKRGGAAPAAVAMGIAVECREQADRHPALRSEKLLPCLLHDLYLTVSDSRRDGHARPSIKASSGEPRSNGLVLAGRTLIEGDEQICEVELPFDPKDRLYYWFDGNQEWSFENRYNVVDDALKVPQRERGYKRNVQLSLRIAEDGEVTPKFRVPLRKPQRDEHPFVELQGKPFHLGDNQIVEGRTYFGLDFGTSNSYAVRFIQRDLDSSATDYPEFSVSKATRSRLLEFEEHVRELQAQGKLSQERIKEHADKITPELVFHSNKIEGNPLTRGETEQAIRAQTREGLSSNESEAWNLDKAHRWVVEHCDAATHQLEPFVRHVNDLLLKGVHHGGGRFRTEEVALRGVDYRPPPHVKMEEYMRRLSEEIRASAGTTSAIELAVRAHTKFVMIHPFVDGNGRTARLLVNAILLQQGLPAIVVNADDRAQYFDALLSANKGPLDPLLHFFLGFLEESLEDVETNATVAGTAESDPAPPPADEADDELRVRLRAILQSGQRRWVDRRGAAYGAWQKAYELLRTGASHACSRLDSLPEFQDEGLDVQCEAYDMLTEERYDEFCRRKRAASTWHFLIRLHAPWGESVRVMFWFSRVSDSVRREKPSSSPVSVRVGIARGQDAAYKELKDEPLGLREIAYDGELQYRMADGTVKTADATGVFEELILELIDSYLYLDRSAN